LPCGPIFLYELIFQTTFSPWWEQVLSSRAIWRSVVIGPAPVFKLTSIDFSLAMFIVCNRDCAGQKALMLLFAILYLCSEGELMPFSRIVNIREHGFSFFEIGSTAMCILFSVGKMA
jgi:hypothetical protein